QPQRQGGPQRLLNGELQHSATSSRQWIAWHATNCRSAIGLSCGTLWWQTSVTEGQRARNGQPNGISTGLGGSPSSLATSLRDRPTVDRRCRLGIEAINARVYGCSGALKTRSQSPISTIRPRYITATRWLICLMTRRSWEIIR